MIYLYDASAIICAATLSKQKGRYSKEARGDFNYYSFPIAGTLALMSYIVTDLKKLKQGDSIAVAFDCHMKDNIRKKYYPDYKIKRIKFPELGTIKPDMSLTELKEKINKTYPKPKGASDEWQRDKVEEIAKTVVKWRAIAVQKDLLKWMLRQVGVVVLENEILEGDDLIYSVCNKYGKDHKIFLRADDSDLYDCKHYAEDFIMHSVSGKGRLEPFTGGIFEKIFHGDLKDGIYSLYSSVDKQRLNKLNIAIRKGVYDTSVLGNPEVLMEIGFTYEETENIIKNNFLKTPKIVDVQVDPVTYNHAQLEKMFSIFGFDSLLKRIGGKRYKGEDLKGIHENIYGALPLFVREWYYAIRYSLDEGEINNDILEELEVSKTIKDIDGLMSII